MNTTLDEVFTSLKTAGLGRVADRLTSAARPGLQLRTIPTDESALGVGWSKLGGSPDAPRDFRWPTSSGTPLSFLGQIDLEEVHAFPCGGILPPSGLLHFFYEVGRGRWGGDPDDYGSWAVSYSPALREPLVRQEPPPSLPPVRRFPSCALQLREVLTLPSWQSLFVGGLGLDDDEIDRYFVVLQTMNGDDELGSRHRLLGHATPIQREMQTQCARVARGFRSKGRSPGRRRATVGSGEGAASWRLLLQVDSDDAAGMMWGDAGRLYFWIREGDLGARRFDRSWMILQCL